jgi:hypothetical protein
VVLLKVVDSNTIVIIIIMPINFEDTDAHIVRPAFAMQDVRNGALETIVAMVPRSAIGQEYRWIVVAGMPRELLVPRLETIAQITAAYMVVNGMTRADARRRATVLAAIRVAATIHYDLTEASLSAGEALTTVFVYRAAVARDDTANPPVAAVPAGVDANWPAGVADAGNAEIDAWTHFTDAERLVASDHMLLGMAIPVTQGWSIVKCGHHFLSPEASGMRAGWNAIKRQFMGKIDRETVTWIQNNSDWWEDVCFHKATHPIDMALKVAIAQSEEYKKKIKAADWGSATVRLPATEPDFEFAKVTLALASKVRATIEDMAGTITTAELEARVDSVFDAITPQERSDAIAAAVQFARLRTTYIAFMAGMLDAITTAAGLGGNTILRAKGLVRVVADEPAAFAKGQSAFRNHSARVLADAARGIIAAPNIVM